MMTMVVVIALPRYFRRVKPNCQWVIFFGTDAAKSNDVTIEK